MLPRYGGEGEIHPDSGKLPSEHFQERAKRKNVGTVSSTGLLHDLVWFKKNYQIVCIKL